MKNILVPTDFSEPARQAFEVALNIAAFTKSEVSVLHVIDLPIMYETTFGIKPYVFDQTVKREMASLAKQNFEKLLESVERPGEDVKVHFKIEQGSVASTIHDFIFKNNMDIVVMSTRGAGGWKYFFVGSTTEKLIRISPAPVLSVNKSFSVDSIKNIVFPTNLSLKHDTIAQKVKEVQLLFQAKLHILFVNTPGNFQRDKEIHKDMEKFSRHYNFSNFTLNIRNDIYEEYGIINFVKEIEPDLIAMGTHGRRGVAHLVMGSIAEDVLDNVQCAVWTIKTNK